MRNLFALTATGILLLGNAGMAGAAVLNFSGSTTILLGDYPRGELRGGGVATINHSSGVIPAHLQTLRLKQSRGQIRGSFTKLVTDPEVLGDGVAALIFENVSGGTGTFWGISGGASSGSSGNVGILPESGLVKICLLSTTCTAYLPLILNQPTTVNGVPGSGTKGVGVGGLITAGGYGGIRISLQAAPWTIKTATVIDQITINKGLPNQTRIFVTWTAKGWAHAPASTTTSTAQPSGVVQLVTPAQIASNLLLGSSDKIGALAISVIRFVPEPGLLLLLGSGVAGLACLGRIRMRD